ncbi:MAG: Hsp70 family protein, partial [Clostridia bacterium]|nr:Hsp70 family protein [Clostridia bacterium]
QADQLIYQTDKTLKEMGDKLDPADKAKVESELESFKQTRASNNVEQIKSAMESFSKSTMDVFAKVYQQNPQGGAGDPGAGTGYTYEGGQSGGVNDDGTVDSEFTDNN